MKFLIGLCGSTLALTAFFAPAAYADTEFTLDPVGGAVSGAPGDTVGWGCYFLQ